MVSIEMIVTAQSVEGGKIYRAWIWTPTDTGMSGAQRVEDLTREKRPEQVDGYRATTAIVDLPAGSVVMTTTSEFFAVRDAGLERRGVVCFGTMSICHDGDRKLVLHGESACRQARSATSYMTSVPAIRWIGERIEATEHGRVTAAAA